VRVHFWSADAAGSSFYRAILPGMSLQWLGHNVSGGMRLPKDWPALDAVVGCRVAQREPSLMWHKLKDEGKRLVLDLDDDYFHIDPSNAAAVRVWDTDMLGRLVANMQIADLVTCCSEPLAAVLRDYAADVRVIPNGLPAQYLGHPRDYEADGRPLHVGWAGTSSTVAELPEAVRALNRISQYRRPGGVMVRLVGIGPGAGDGTRAAGPADRRAGLGGADRALPARGRRVRRVVCAVPGRPVQLGEVSDEVPGVEHPRHPADRVGHRAVSAGDPARGERVPRPLRTRVGPVPEAPRRRSQAAPADGHDAARGEASGSILQAINIQWEAALSAPAAERNAA
jgi:hypothetical protein